MTRIQLLLGVTLSLGMASCASTETYGPAADDRKSGYSERTIEDGRYRVTYRARTMEEARDGALRRAAELTLAGGGTWFQVTNAYSDEEENRSRPSVSIGGSTGSHHSGVGIGLGFPLGGSSGSAEHSLEFVTGDGDRPEGGMVYDAASVLGSSN
jgi:hypothetical protein